MIVGRDVLGSAALKREEVEAEAWGGTVLVRELTGEEVADARAIATKAVNVKTQDVTDNSALTDFQCMLVVKGWIGEDGRRVMADGEAGLLRKEPNSIIQKMAERISILSGLTEESIGNAKKN